MSDRDRQKLHRARARNGARVVRVELTPAREELLLAARALAEWDADDRDALGHAIEKLLDLLLLADRHA